MLKNNSCPRAIFKILGSLISVKKSSNHLQAPRGFLIILFSYIIMLMSTLTIISMILKNRMLGQTYEFKDVKDLLAKASEKKSGDELAGVCADSALQRIAAKETLSQLTVADIRENPVVPYENDSVTRIIQDDID